MASLQTVISAVVLASAILSICGTIQGAIDPEISTEGHKKHIPPCDSPVYCDGPILKAVQTSGLFPDSKTFVDMPMKVDPDQVLRSFSKINAADKGELKKFIDDNFEEAGSDTEFVTPEDWVDRPAFVDNIRDRKLQEWALALNKLWKILLKRTKSDVLENPQRYSLIPLPHPFLIPGGRFHEFYYWDTFWIIKGLLLCNMTKTVKGFLLNYVSLINRYGLIPNGARNYFTRRSQPPLFAAMVQDYVNNTGDTEFVNEALPALEKEYEFWLKYRNVTVWKQGKSYNLQRYVSNVTKPRPEGYLEDTATALKVSADKTELYGELQAGAESGWDFSARWFNRDGPNNMTTSSIRTSKIVPVDLNSIMYTMETSLENFNRLLGNKDKERYFAKQKADRLDAIDNILWDDTAGSWFDFDIEHNESNPHFYLSAGFPIFADCHGSSTKVKQQREKAILAYLRSSGALDYPGGIPTSLYKTGQQWDFPNAWPPLVHVIIMGLARSEIESVREAARNLAQQWVKTNYNAWKGHSHMFEKYDVTTGSGPGGGGEYDVQVGFGWTNGVILDLLHHFGDVLTSDDSPSSTKDNEDDSPTEEQKSPSKQKKRHANSPDKKGDNSQNQWDYPMIGLLTFIVIISACVFVFILYARQQAPSKKSE